MQRVRELYDLGKEATESYVRHNDGLLGGALAFYALLSSAPLGVIAVAVAGLAFGRAAATGVLVAELRGPLGAEAARFVATIMEQAREPITGGIATVLGGLVLLFAASRLFAQLRRALNHVMGVRVKTGIGFRRSATAIAIRRLLAFGMVFLCGLLLTTLLIARAMVGALGKIFDVPVLWRVVEMGASFGVLAVLFAVIFKLLPDVRIAWRDVCVGALTTALLLGLGTLPISWYLGNVDVASAYGAAGTLVVLLIWVYYSSQLFFLGAELTRVWATRRGRGVQPKTYTVRVVEQADEEASPPT